MTEYKFHTEMKVKTIVAFIFVAFVIFALLDGDRTREECKTSLCPEGSSPLYVTYPSNCICVTKASPTKASP